MLKNYFLREKELKQVKTTGNHFATTKVEWSPAFPVVDIINLAAVNDYRGGRFFTEASENFLALL